ncbi:DUF3992 domain-containing protein [Paenibacillus sp. OV219]|uniref:DUF3992 domain-containing protein n=1 Tax=Paenibacillus sp. OV219 TaxID=1884377 RepID=UPI0008C4661F|nr:S-Ena type endospore appendage [Paenibacillus sp. OV219]SEM80280.1 Protein of unknown function [Paenibacillus sp. OV219]
MSCSNSASALTCCSEKNYVQDKVCSPWSGTVVAADVTVIVFTNNLNQNLVGTGYVQYDVGPAAITFNLLNSAGAPMITPITIEPGTSLAFTYRRFASITLTLPGTDAGTYQGEFCITARYPIT